MRSMLMGFLDVAASVIVFNAISLLLGYGVSREASSQASYCWESFIRSPTGPIANANSS
jgi:hypothetical protein